MPLADRISVLRNWVSFLKTKFSLGEKGHERKWINLC